MCRLTTAQRALSPISAIRNLHETSGNIKGVRILCFKGPDTFDRPATRILEDQFPETTTTITNADGSTTVSTSRSNRFFDLKEKLDRFVNAAKASVGTDVDSVERATNRVLNSPTVAGTTLSGAQILGQFNGIPYRIDRLFTAFWNLSNAFNSGNGTAFANSIEAISTALSDAGLRGVAVSFSQQLIRNGATQHALGVAYRTHEAEAWLQTRDAIRDFAVQFALVDLPIMIATSVLSAGTLSAAYATWRIATGIRLSARVLMAAEIAVSIPINSAIQSAVTGEPIDTSALGLLRQAGFLVGTRTAGKIIGAIGNRAITALRARLPNAQRIRARLTQDMNVSPIAPPALELTRPIGRSATQNARLQSDIARLEREGAVDFRVNQQQVNIAGQRVGVNRPDLQYTLNGKRYYVEYDTRFSMRGWRHRERLLANDPDGIVELLRVD